MKLESSKTNEYSMYFTMKSYEIRALIDALKKVPAKDVEYAGPVFDFIFYLESTLQK